MRKPLRPAGLIWGLLVIVSLLFFVGGCSSSPEQQKAEHLQKAREFVKAKKFSEAKIEYLNAIQVAPKDAQLHYQLGEVYLYLKDGRKAVRELQEAIKKQEKSLVAMMKDCRKEIFTAGDRVDLPAGSLLHLVGKKLKISRATLALLEDQGFEDGIKVAKSVDRGVLAEWPEEKLALVKAEMKRTEDYTYELRGE